MRKQEKEQIREALRQYAAKYPSQNKAAASLTGVSAATVSTILNGKDELVSDTMWQQIAKQIGMVTDGWQVVETTTFVEITTAMEDAQRLRNVLWITGEAGCGKTTAAKSYSSSHRDAFYLLCSEDLKKGDFIRGMARVVGVKVEGYTINQQWSKILDALIQLDHPLIILDEADKLTENVFSYFVSLYNRLEDHAGIIFMSTDYIVKRIRIGLQHERKGYKEIFSRIGRKYYDLEPATTNDVTAICRANGVTDPKDIEQVLREAATKSGDWNVSRQDGVVLEYDFRRVKKSVQRTLLLRRHG